MEHIPGKENPADFLTKHQTRDNYFLTWEEIQDLNRDSELRNSDMSKRPNMEIMNTTIYLQYGTNHLMMIAYLKYVNNEIAHTSGRRYDKHQ